MELSINEIITLITRLYMPLKGYWIYEIKECPEANKFLNAGYLSLQEKHKDKYTINSKGRDYLQPYIQAISIDFIKFMKSRHMTCANLEIVQWYMDNYLIDDKDIATEITEYICKNLEKYDYKATPFYSSTIGNGYKIEETSK